MDKVTLSPDENGYTFKDGAEVLRTQLSSGRGRFTRGILNAAIPLTVQWTCDEGEYDYLMEVHRQHVAEGYAPFQIDLIIDTDAFVEHWVRMMPGSFGLSSHRGRSYVMQATLEVLPTSKTLFTGTIPKLTLPPDKDGYTFTMESAGVHQPLDGGLGRVFRDQIGVTTKINVKWTTNAAGFLYLREFYRQWVTKPDAFPMDLFLQTHELEEHNVWFVPGSVGLDSISGKRFVLSAQIEVDTDEALDPAEECDCSTTMWQINFEAEFGNIETTELPMAFGTGEIYTPYWNLAITGDTPIYGDRSLMLGGTSGDEMYFYNPAVTSSDVWTIRFSIVAPEFWFNNGTDIVLLTTYNSSLVATLQLAAIPYEGGGFQFRIQHLQTEDEWLSSPYSDWEGARFDLELSYGYTDTFAGKVRLFEGGAIVIQSATEMELQPPDGLTEIYWMDTNLNGVANKWDEIRVVNYVEHTGSYAPEDDLPFCVCVDENAGPWLYFNTHDEAESQAPMYVQFGSSFTTLTADDREPFAYGVGVSNNDGSGQNNGSQSTMWVPLYYAGLGGGDDGSLPTLPVEGTHYTWEPADPESLVVPRFTLDDPSGGAWEGAATHFLTLELDGGFGGAGLLIGWGGGVLTLYANNDPVGGAGQQTIITFLPSSFVYPPVSAIYGPLA